MVLKGPHIVLAHLVAALPEFFGTLSPKRDPSDIHDNIAQSLGHSVQSLASTLVRLPDDIVVILGPA